MQYINFFEAGISVLAFALGFLNYILSLRLKTIEEKIKDLDEFKQSADKKFEVLHKMSGQLEFIVFSIKKGEIK